MATPATAATAASLATTVVRTTTVFFAISGPLKIEDFEGRGRRKNRTDYSRPALWCSVAQRPGRGASELRLQLCSCRALLLLLQRSNSEATSGV